MSDHGQYIDIHTHHPRPDVASPRMAGVHPWSAEEVVAIPLFEECDIVGETGLDYAVEVNREAQERLFREHLSWAERTGKPVVLHCVKAFEPMMNILRSYKLQGVVFHSFIGNTQQAERCFARGYHLSFGARSLRSPKSREVLRQMPAEYLFCETDNDMVPAIEEVYRMVAEIRGTTPQELLEQIEKNYKQLFR